MSFSSKKLTAEDIENALGGDAPGGDGTLPTGGVEGQVLTKLSDTDGDADWVDLPEAGGTAWTEITGDPFENEDLSEAFGGKADKVVEGTTGHFIAVASADGAMTDSGWKAEDFEPAGAAADIMTSTISSGDTDHAPTSSAVFTALLLKLDSDQVGTTVTPLVDGFVPSAYLPGYVDDVLEFDDFASLPETGESGKIYITIDDGAQYRWSGSAYIELVGSPGTTDEVTEGSTNLYFTSERVLDTVGSVSGVIKGDGAGGITAATAGVDYATAAQGSKADSAIQTDDLAVVATTGNYSDLAGLPTLGTAASANTTAFATSTQGTKADSAVQPDDLAEVATTGSYNNLTDQPTLGTAAAAATTDFATTEQGSKADTAVQPGSLSTVATTGDYDDLTNKPTNSLLVVDVLGEVEAGTTTLDLSSGNVFDITLTDDVTLAFSNLPGADQATDIQVIIRQDATGNHTVTWSANGAWVGGTPAVVTATESSVDVIKMTVFSTGSWFGFAFSDMS